ncbi:MAG: RHS repeat-associated core domain-containing protein, partial [Muribaculaceae bacterium]|nr:RHS repeat-associated core domain-containing protein [Muribaculaceae bacterium]
TNNIIKTIHFENTSSYTNGKRKLSAIRFLSENELIDQYDFTYNTGSYSSGTDLYGNYNASGQFANNSILDYRSGLPTNNRRHSASAAQSNLLKNITTGTGVTTTFTYESNSCTIDTITVGIGLRVKQIEIQDATSNRRQLKTYTYDDAVSTIDFSRLSYSSFISQSGIINYTNALNPQYTTNSVFTTSSRHPGFQVEDATIYYGKVTEHISGTGLTAPIKNEYEFDLEYISHPYIPAGSSIPSTAQENTRYVGTKIYHPNFVQTEVAKRNRIFKPQLINGYFQETCWDKAPMKRHVQYRCDENGIYHKEKESRHVYSLDKDNAIITGIYCESLIRRIINNMGLLTEDFETTNDFNFFETKIQSGRLFRDTTEVITYYPDGNTRKETTTYQYNGRNRIQLQPRVLPPIWVDTLTHLNTIAHPGFRADSIKPSNNARLIAVKTTCGDISHEHYICYSSNINTPFYNAISDSGYTSLPVMEKWVMGSDTTLRVREYGKYNTPSGQRNSIHLSADKLYNLKGEQTEITTRRLLAYDNYGNLLKEQRDGGPVTEYEWGYRNSCITARTIAGDIRTEYRHAPLVGCTKITEPSGIVRNYEYRSGRLVKETGSMGQTLSTYSYTIHSGATTLNSIIHNRYQNTDSHISQKQIYDGFGQQLSTIGLNTSPGGGNIVQAMEYDALGRLKRTWQPFPTTESGYQQDITGPSATYYDDTRPYTEYEYENSTRSRATTEILPGEAFANHPIRHEYLCNNQTSELKCRKYSITTQNTLRCEGYYPSGTLDVVKTIDGDNNIMLIFTDVAGRKILERRKTGNTYADTYYISDNYGRPLLILPPMASKEFTTEGGTWSITDNTTIQRYAYTYRYDDRHQCIYKKLPGRGAIRYKYDAGLRLVAEQDGNMQSSMQWLTHFYDKYGREVISGIMNGDESEIDLLTGESITATLDGSQENYGYSFSRPLPLLIEPFTAVNYYDHYNFIRYAGESDTTLFTQAEPPKLDIIFPLAANGPPIVYTPPPVGMLTGALTFTGSDSTPLLSVSYYDMQGNEVERHSRNHSGGMEHEKRTYSFTSQPLTIERVHTSAEGDTLVSRRIEYHYDNADRLTSITHQINDHPETTISQVSYDAIGRRHSQTTGALTTTYSHDVHGWLTKMENSRFSQELLYTTGVTPCYNGNISSMMWRGADGITRRYDYSYDGMSRLTGAAYSESGRTAIPGLTIQGTPDYSTSYSYDLNGNPTQIYRKGIAHKYASGSNRQWQYDEIDNLYIDYRGNQVNFTDDSCPWGYYEEAPGYIEESYDDNEYAWDANGNMTKDLNRGITSIQYNLQNMPTRIVYNDRHYENRLYNSLGEKLRTIHTVFVTSSTSSSTSTAALITENKRDYYGEDLVYRNDTLEMVLTDVGYVDAQGRYYYYILDYQGNIRQVVDAQGNVLEQNDYYPYGGLFGESASHQSYKYSGKELERMNGLNTYDFHARPYYYPVLQFHSPDILSEEKPWNSPYLYCSGNPINRIDPSGMADIYAIKKGKAVLIGYNGVDDNDVYVVTRDVKKAVEKATKNGNAYTGVLREGDNVVKIPTGNQMTGVVESVNQSAKSQKENGGHAMKGDNSVVHWDEGGEPITDDKENSISIRPFKIGGKSKIPNNVNDVEFYWHTHPNRKINKNSSFGSSKPSPKDRTFQKEMQQSGYNGNTFVIGLRENKVTFYNKDKNIITMPYPVFVNLGNR